ncbi:MAG: adenylate/guanylate cyclase domain-containing protein [Chloroflexota bacterium]|nr:adenylate/guanylate cyclase domain-containing protein [Chloroflexota bacterium]
MHAPPRTQYARAGDLHIAYQVVGDGPFDLLWVPGWVSNVEAAWEEPELAAFLGRLASFSRLILFDKRGTGLSDPVPLTSLPGLEERMEDVRAVLDVAGSERAALFGFSEGGNLSATFAASHPARTRALVMFGVFAARRRQPDYPWAPSGEERAAAIEDATEHWGDEMDVSSLVPSRAREPALVQRLTRYFRRSASPGAAAALLRMNTDIDIRHVLPSITSPTLVLHRRGDREANVEEGRYVAGRIPGARFTELSGADHLPWIGETEPLLDEVEEFLTGVRPDPPSDRVLATVMFTDLVGSTDRLAALGDRRWLAVLEEHRAAVRLELHRWRGVEIDTAGDGFLATFDGPARAVRCALAVTAIAANQGLQVRAGVHTGEVERRGPITTGIAIHIGARVASAAAPGEVLVSSTVKDLVAGSGLAFEDRGLHTLKGVADAWHLFRAGGD